jgi:hypothetical protein
MRRVSRTIDALSDLSARPRRLLVDGADSLDNDQRSTEAQPDGWGWDWDRWARPRAW